MPSDLKQEYLNAKYAYVDGYVDTKPKKKSKRKTPKKAKHKHHYENIIIDYIYPKNYPSQDRVGKKTYVLRSYCTICGKLGEVQEDTVVKQLFPHIWIEPFGFVFHISKYNQEYEDYNQWSLSHYPHYYMPDYFNVVYGSGQIFLDIDKITPAKELIYGSD